MSREPNACLYAECPTKWKCIGLWKCQHPFRVWEELDEFASEVAEDSLGYKPKDGILRASD